MAEQANGSGTPWEAHEFGARAAPMPMLVQVPIPSPAHSASLRQGICVSPEQVPQAQSMKPNGVSQALSKPRLELPVLSARSIPRPVPLMFAVGFGGQSRLGPRATLGPKLGWRPITSQGAPSLGPALSQVPSLMPSDMLTSPMHNGQGCVSE